MNLVGLKTYTKKTYPALLLERLISRRYRRYLRKTVGLAFGISLILVFVLDSQLNLTSPLLPSVGGAMILLALWLILILLELFFRASYFRNEPALVDFETALIIHSLKEVDVTGSFLATPLGREIIWRAGVPDSAVLEFLKMRVTRLALAQCLVKPAVAGEIIVLSDLVRAIYETDREFGQLLFKEGVQEADLAATADWLKRVTARRKAQEQWWGREALGRISGLAKDWSYGRAFNLEKYGHRL